MDRGCKGRLLGLSVAQCSEKHAPDVLPAPRFSLQLPQLVGGPGRQQLLVGVVHNMTAAPAWRAELRPLLQELADVSGEAGC